MKPNVVWILLIYVQFLCIGLGYRIQSNYEFGDKDDTKLDSPYSDLWMDDEAIIGSCDDNLKRDCGGAEGDNGGENKEKPQEKKLSGFEIARKAAQTAKSATMLQHRAGIVASQIVRKKLAEKAMNAAKAAEADLMSKKDVLQHIMSDVERAKTILGEKTKMRGRAECTYRLALRAFEKSRDHYKALSKAMENAERNIEVAERAHDGAQEVVEKKILAIQSGRSRIQTLKERIERAQKELEKTKELVKQTKDAVKQTADTKLTEDANGESGFSSNGGGVGGESDSSDGVKCRRCSIMQENMDDHKR